jgi:hypothetical protein
MNKVMRRLHASILIFLILANLTVFAQAPATCNLTGTVFNPDGTLAVGVQFRVSKITKNGALFSQGPFIYTTDSNGIIRDTLNNSGITLPQGSAAYIYSIVPPWNVTGGVPINVPNSSSASLASLSTVAAVPTTGATVQTGSGPTTLTNREGTFWFTTGLKATETAPGIAKIEIDTASSTIVPGTRTISTTNPLRIDGGASADISSNRTLSINGLAGLGTGNQFVGMNSGASGFEYKSFATGTSGSDFAITHGTNTITFNIPDASGSARGLITSGTQTIAGNKTFPGVTQLGGGTNYNEGGQAGQGGSAQATQIAIGSSGTPNSTNTPVLSLQKQSSVNLTSTGSEIPFLFSVRKQSGGGNLYAISSFVRMESSTQADAAAVFGSIYANPSSTPGSTQTNWAGWFRAERAKTGTRISGAEFDAVNSTDTDASRTSTSSNDATFGINIVSTGYKSDGVSLPTTTARNTAGILLQAGDSGINGAFFTGIRFDPNSAVDYGVDFKPLGTVVGAPIRYANSSYPVWRNNGDSADKRFVALTTGDVWNFDPDGLGSNFNAQVKITKTNSTDSIAASSLLLENPAGTATEIYFTFAGIPKVTLRGDSSGNAVWNSVGNNFYFNQDYGGAPTFNSLNGAINHIDGLKAALGTITSGKLALDTSATWNSGGTIFTGLKFNATDTASAAASLLFDFQKGGTSQISGDKNGNLTITGVFKAGTGPTTLTNSTGQVLDAAIVSALTGKTYNGLTVNTTTGTLGLANGKTATINNTLTFSGTDSSSVAFGGGGTIGSVGYASVGQIPGTATNDSASAGNVGQVISSNIASGSAITLATGTTSNLTSLSLTAGDWDVWVYAYFVPGGTVSLLDVGVSQTSATLGFANGDFTQIAYPGLTLGNTTTVGVGPSRVSLASTTTVFGVVQATFGTSCTAYGLMRARRVR